MYTVEEAQGKEEQEGETGKDHYGVLFILSETRGETSHTWSGHNKSPNTTEVVRELSPAVYSQYSSQYSHQSVSTVRSPNNVHREKL